MKRDITIAELARRVSCAKTYVYRQCKEGGRLFNAVLPGSRIDLNHPDAAHFCASFNYQEPDGAEIAKKVRAETKKPRRSAPKAVDQYPSALVEPTEGPDPGDISAGELLEMPLRDVVATFGTASHLQGYVAVVKALVQTRGYEEDQARKRKDYIHRVHVEQLVAYIDALQKSLLTDTVRNMATRATAQVKSGESQLTIEESMCEVISRTIKSVKSDFERRLLDV